MTLVISAMYSGEDKANMSTTSLFTNAVAPDAAALTPFTRALPAICGNRYTGYLL
ncbi:MAG: hypothetical protein AAAFM81_05055 [Pseudomonadota bacterium]